MADTVMLATALNPASWGRKGDIHLFFFVIDQSWGKKGENGWVILEVRDAN